MKHPLRTHILSGLFLLITVATVATAFVLPGSLVRKGADAEVGIVKPVPTDYYAGPSEAVVKNASRQLTEEQRQSLIYGEWESEISPATENECNFTRYEIVSRYTYPIVSEYQQWYTWTAESYKAVDTTFLTYAAVFWHVVFTRYDGSETHEYFITEGGTLLDKEKIRLPE
jgi:hypothetical protein